MTETEDFSRRQSSSARSAFSMKAARLAIPVNELDARGSLAGRLVAFLYQGQNEHRSAEVEDDIFKVNESRTSS